MIMDAGFPKGPVADIVDSFGPNGFLYRHLGGNLGPDTLNPKP